MIRANTTYETVCDACGRIVPDDMGLAAQGHCGGYSSIRDRRFDDYSVDVDLGDKHFCNVKCLALHVETQLDQLALARKNRA